MTIELQIDASNITSLGEAANVLYRELMAARLSWPNAVRAQLAFTGPNGHTMLIELSIAEQP
jgi:hypothetical protein